MSGLVKKNGRRMIEETKERTESTMFLENNRLNERCFVRKRKLGFRNCVMLIIDRMTVSRQMAIDNFLEQVLASEETLTGQAFSKARQLIKPEAFRELFDITARIAATGDGIRRYNGYRIFGIDGTQLTLPISNETRKQYPNVNKEQYNYPRARVSVLCDLMDGHILDAQITNRQTDERTLAKRNLEACNKYLNSKDIVIFDRGYPSRKLITSLYEKEYRFLMRIQKSFNSCMDQSSSEDFNTVIRLENTRCCCRVVKVILPSGETEMLITNLDREQFSAEDLKKLYSMRWGVESTYNTIKTKWQIEKFSGRTVVSIEQDFFATMMLQNIATALAVEANEKIRKANQFKQLKYEYVANMNLLIGKLKVYLVSIMLEDSQRKRAWMYKRLTDRITHFVCPVRPGRSFPRPYQSHKRICPSPKNSF